MPAVTVLELLAGAAGTGGVAGNFAPGGRVGCVECTGRRRTHDRGATFGNLHPRPAFGGECGIDQGQFFRLGIERRVRGVHLRHLQIVDGGYVFLWLQLDVH